MLEIKRNSTISLRHLKEFLEERDELYAEEDDEEDSGLDSLNSNSSGGSYDHQDRDLFEEVPDKLNFIGLITHYKEIQKVQWQREIIITDRYDFARTWGFPDVSSDFPDVSCDFPDVRKFFPDVS